MQAYDPLDYDNLARSVVDALLAAEQVALPPAEPFEGAGVYAVYYPGSFEGYDAIVNTNPQPPIYVGKAVPAGARKGGGLVAGGCELHKRLKEHGKTIAQAKNIRI